MYNSSIEHGKIIEAFRRNVPGCYVRDYRDNGGYITICRYYKDIRWRDNLSAGNVYKQVPAITLCSLPRGFVKPATMYRGLRLERPGWRLEFRKAARHLTDTQMRRISKFLGGQVFTPGRLK